MTRIDKARKPIKVTPVGIAPTRFKTQSGDFGGTAEAPHRDPRQVSSPSAPADVADSPAWLLLMIPFD